MMLVTEVYGENFSYRNLVPGDSFAEMWAETLNIGLQIQ